jgi:hypothetical protein
MQRKLMLTLAGAAVGMAMSLSSAQAFTPGNMAGVTPEETVQKVHFRHRSCELGPLGWHRHSWSGYRVACWPRARHPHRCFIDRWGYRHCAW